MIIESLITAQCLRDAYRLPCLTTPPYEISNHNYQVSTIIENRHLKRIAGSCDAY